MPACFRCSSQDVEVGLPVFPSLFWSPFVCIQNEVIMKLIFDIFGFSAFLSTDIVLTFRSGGRDLFRECKTS